MKIEDKQKNRQKRKMHIRKTVSGTASKPRLSVFRSNNHIFAQAIDDVNSVTLVSASDFESKTKKNNIETATKVGETLGEKLKKIGVEAVIFDRNGYKYHGKVKALADGIRAAGIKF